MKLDLSRWLESNRDAILQALPAHADTALCGELLGRIGEAATVESSSPLLDLLRTRREQYSVAALARHILDTRDAINHALNSSSKSRTKKVQERTARVAGLCETALLLHLAKAETQWQGERERLVRWREIDETRRLLTSELDPLTRVFNQRHFHGRLEEEVERAMRYGETLSLLICDIDHFKRLNEEFSPQAGEEALRSVATTLNQLTRRVDCVSRISWDEFAVILPEIGIHGAYSTAEKIRHGIEKLHFAPGHPLCGWTLSVSIGAANYHLDAATAHSLLGAARDCLNRAKHSGRNRVCASM